MTAFPSPEAGWQIALVGAVGTFIALLVLRLTVQVVRVILSRFSLDVEELTYVPPEMPLAEAAPQVSRAVPRRAEVQASRTPAASVEEAPTDHPAATAPTPNGDMGAIVAAIACAIHGQEAAPAAPAATPSSIVHGVRSAWCMVGRLNLIHREPRKRNK